MKAIAPLKTVLDLFKCQLAASLIALIILAIFKHTLLLSFFLGAFVMLAGNGFLAWRVYRQNKRIRPLSLLSGFLGGEAGKYFVLLVLTFILAKAFVFNWLFYIIGIAVPQLFGVILYLLWSRFKVQAKPQ